MESNENIIIYNKTIHFYFFIKLDAAQLAWIK